MVFYIKKVGCDVSHHCSFENLIASALDECYMSKSMAVFQMRINKIGAWNAPYVC